MDSPSITFSSSSPLGWAVLVGGASRQDGASAEGITQGGGHRHSRPALLRTPAFPAGGILLFKLRGWNLFIPSFLPLHTQVFFVVVESVSSFSLISLSKT